MAFFLKGAEIVSIKVYLDKRKAMKERECEQISYCGFYLKFKDGCEPVLMGFIREYCKGPKSGKCARKVYNREHGRPPDDNMMPSGRFYRY